MKLGMIAAVLFLSVSSLAPGDDKPTDSKKTKKKVLVELYTSQGCDSCPSANDFLGQLTKLGYGPDQIIPVAFHVDYFNTPWVDPFSSNDYSKRELAYNSVQKRTDLYFTPMMMVDGRYPMLGSNRAEAFSSIRKALAEKPGTSIEMAVSGSGSSRSLQVDVTPLTPTIKGRDLMIGVTITEGPVSTRVPSGENAGKTLVEPFVVRSFQFKKVKLDGLSTQNFSFPLKLSDGAVASKCRVAAFVQDWDDGTVHQAESIPWNKIEVAR